MPAKKKAPVKEKEDIKKRIKPVIEEVIEGEDQSQEPETPQVEAQTTAPQSVVPLQAEEAQPEVASAMESVSTPETEIQKEESSSEPEIEPMEDSGSSSHSDDRRVNLKMIVAITIVSALVAAFVSGGVYVYLSSTRQEAKVVDEAATEEPASEETPEPTSTPEASEEVDVSSYSVRVLNGSGAIGAASGGEKVLIDAGFDVDSTGNASRYDYESTVIQAKEEVAAEALAKAKKALEDAEYKVEVGDTLPSSEAYDIIVTVGSN